MVFAETASEYYGNFPMSQARCARYLLAYCAVGAVSGARGGEGDYGFDAGLACGDHEQAVESDGDAGAVG